MREVKRITAILFLFLFMSGVGWLYVEGLSPGGVNVGSKLPEIHFSDLNGHQQVMRNLGMKAMVVYFSPVCDHCDYQLKELEKNIERLRNVRIFLFTSYNEFLEYEGMNKYPDLSDMDDVIFGIVDYDEYDTKYGSNVTPTTYIADENGEVTGKFKGRTKFIDMEEVLFPGIIDDD